MKLFWCKPPFCSFFIRVSPRPHYLWTPLPKASRQWPAFACHIFEGGMFLNARCFCTSYSFLPIGIGAIGGKFSAVEEKCWSYIALFGQWAAHQLPEAGSSPAPPHPPWPVNPCPCFCPFPCALPLPPHPHPHAPRQRPFPPRPCPSTPSP